MPIYQGGRTHPKNAPYGIATPFLILAACPPRFQGGGSSTVLIYFRRAWRVCVALKRGFVGETGTGSVNRADFFGQRCHRAPPLGARFPPAARGMARRKVNGTDLLHHRERVFVLGVPRRRGGPLTVAGERRSEGGAHRVGTARAGEVVEVGHALRTFGVGKARIDDLAADRLRSFASAVQSSSAARMIVRCGCFARGVSATALRLPASKAQTTAWPLASPSAAAVV